MREDFDVETPQHWKALSHPLRVQALRLLGERPMTNEELAAALGVQSGKLYFHTKRLLDAGMIALVEMRQKGAITEKVYRAVARRYLAPPLAKGENAPALEPCLLAALDLYRSAWQEMERLPEGAELGFHLIVPMTPERQREFVRQVQALSEDFRASESDAADAQPVSLAVLLHSLPIGKTAAPGENSK
ncbi:MAG: winged helix-turn-helix domain-containing protein [Armatimonadota bacterium]|nr:winged helix-turn-helix domain-containing protein [Armatimonadota bacterium]